MQIFVTNILTSNISYCKNLQIEEIRVFRRRKGGGGGQERQDEL